MVDSEAETSVEWTDEVFETVITGDSMHKNIMGLMGAIGLLVGCSSNQTMNPLPPVDPEQSPPGAGGIALELEQIREEYETCIERLDEANPTCQNIRWMFEDAWTRYEAAQRPKP